MSLIIIVCRVQLAMMVLMDSQVPPERVELRETRDRKEAEDHLARM